MGAEHQDVIVVGGGLYGVLGALQLARSRRRVVLLEREARLLAGASSINQARVHNGYHYPRSILTGARSHVHYERFAREYGDSVVRHDAYYAIARHGSKVTPAQFERFCGLVGVPLMPVADVRPLADPRAIAALWRVDEMTFNADVLRAVLAHDLAAAGVDVRLSTAATGVDVAGARGRVSTTAGDLEAPLVLNCTYAGLERLASGTGRAHAPALLYELAEIALVRAPADYSDVGLTVMDGPFFSCIPFPLGGCHSLTHVRYTPHVAADARHFPWEACDGPIVSRYPAMWRAALPYAPWLADAEYLGSRYAVKAIPPQREHDDARPIVIFHRPPDAPVVSVLGSKLDNVYDFLAWLEANA